MKSTMIEILPKKIIRIVPKKLICSLVASACQLLPAVSLGQNVVVPAGFDCWRTECGATQFNFCDTPLPADFFGVGSAPFAGVVLLGGAERWSMTPP